MDAPQLEIAGKKTLVRKLEYSAALDEGTAATVETWDSFSGLKKDASVTLHVGAQAFELRVSRFRQNADGAGGAWLHLVDPITAAPRFEAEAFSRPDGEASLADVLQSRLPVGGKAHLKEQKFPAIVVTNRSVRDVVREAAAFGGDWHFRWHQGKVEVGPLPTGAATALDVLDAGETEAGVCCIVAAGIPDVGEKASAAGFSGHVLQMTIEHRNGSEPVVRIWLGAPPPITRSAEFATCLIPALVQQKDPLFVDAELPNGKKLGVRAQLLGLRGGSSRVAMPVEVGDRILLVWPMGVSAGLPIALPMAALPIPAVLEMAADKASLVFKDWKSESDAIDFKVGKLFDIHH